jgi:predicted methyltransferase
MRKLLIHWFLLSASGLGCSHAGAPSAAGPTPAAATTAAADVAEVGTGAAPAPSAVGSSAPAVSSHVNIPPEIQSIVDAPDRSEQDRKLDAGRHPAELLAFAGVKPGMKVAEISAGGGYTTELLARAVGPNGVVYGMNVPFVLERFAEKPWSERLSKPVMKNVVRVDRNGDDPLPPEAKGLDLVIDVLFYHDFFWLKADRAKMNARIFEALRPGGAYVIVDHSGRPGSGATEVQTLHRIEEDVVKQEVLSAGFELDASADFLRNPADQRDWNASPMAAADRRGTSDRFVLRFVKP